MQVQTHFKPSLSISQLTSFSPPPSTMNNHTNPSSHSPTFNSYFNTNLADIAARVTTEFPQSDDFPTDDDDIPQQRLPPTTPPSDDDFEFDLSNLTPHHPVYPLFNRDLLSDETPPLKIQLQSLFLEDRDPPSSSSSSEAGDLDEIPPGTYCAWAPTTSSPSPGRCTKSNSTGSSVSAAAGKAKAWKITEFLKRSKSDGKEGLVVLNSSPKKKVITSSGGKPRRVGAAREGYYGENRNNKNKRRESYLPYRQDLVGLFAAPQALRKMHLPPF